MHRLTHQVVLAPDVGADADDSAKTLIALHHLGSPVSIGPLCEVFELDSHFQCYPYERNPSITVHCHILLALLEAVESRLATKENNLHDVAVTDHGLATSVQKAVTFISETWWTTNAEMIDKWVQIYVIYSPQQADHPSHSI